MPFDDDKRVPVYQFTYKKVFIEISQGLRGGTCGPCKLPHHPHQVSCDNCGKPVKAYPVFYVTMLGTEIMDRPTKQSAVDWAKSFIDYRLDRMQADLETLLNEEDDDEDDDDSEDLLEAMQGKTKLTPLEQQIVQLGWLQKANAILASLQPPA